MFQTEDLAKRAEPLASSLLGVATSEFSLEDITSTFKWVKRHRIFWALTRLDRRSVVIVFRQDGGPLVTTSSAGVPLVSMFLLEETGPLPNGLSAFFLAEAFRQLTVSPIGLVGSPELLKSPFPPLEAWIRSKGLSPETQRKLFEQNCAGPVLRSDPRTKEWTLDFAYFNERGGIEGWTLKGNERQITSATQKTIAQDDSLNWPFE